MIVQSQLMHSLSLIYIQIYSYVNIIDCLEKPNFTIKFETQLLFLFCKIILAILWPLHFHIHFRFSMTILTQTHKKATRVFRVNALSLYIYLERTNTLKLASMVFHPMYLDSLQFLATVLCNFFLQVLHHIFLYVYQLFHIR